MAPRQMRTFWDRVKEALAEAGLDATQDYAAKIAGIKQPSVAEWNRPDGFPSLPNTVKLALRSGVCVEWLYTERGPKRPPPADPTAQRLWEIWSRIDDVTKGEIVRLAIERAGPPDANGLGASKMA